ncbi:MAG: DUF5702 domain-containing protein [Anaerocolumna sp.]
MIREKEGSITVFLSLILLLILAITMTTVEAARVTGAQVYTERALQTAMDSILGEYYLPLFNEYHLFGLDSGYGTDSMDTDRISDKLKDYMGYTFDPGKGLETLEGKSYEFFNIYGINTTNININKNNTLMDFDGELFVNQAVSYMEYKESGDGMESFLPKLSNTQETKKAQTVLEQKQETEGCLYEIDERILSLMKLIDGITINEKGVKLKNDGKIDIQENFVKKLLILPVTKENSGIQNELVFSSLTGHYVNPGQLIDSAMEDINSLNENVIKKESANETYQCLKSIDQRGIKDPDELESLRKSISDAKKKSDSYKKAEKVLISSLNNHFKTLNNLVEGTLSAILSAQKVIDELIPIQGEASLKIQDYEQFLSENREQLNNDFYQGLLDDLSLMEKYKGADGNGSRSVNQYDFKGMKDTLKIDETILLKIKPDTLKTATTNQESWNNLKETLTNIRSMLGSYSYEKLQFDYSTLVKPVESDTFFSGIKSLLEEGLMGLMIEDLDKVSDKKLNGVELPSGTHHIQSGEEPMDIITSISKINLMGGGDVCSGMMDDFSKGIDFKEAAVSGAEGAGKFMLLQEYLSEHFERYDEAGLSNEMKALDYELEYIVMGKSSDYENLKAILMRILLIRTVMNMITLMSDRKSKEEARVLAISFVGFTGFPALVEITKMIILTVWAFAESLVDISVLVQGKNIPLLKKGSDVQIELNEILYLNKTLIRSKADNRKENKTVIDLSYDDYLKLFLYMESQENKSFRAMDLIQETIQLKYENTFFIKNCIFGFQAEAEFEMDSKFIKLPFMKQMLNNKDYNYYFQCSLENAY